ncbi:MAG: VWA domain-containing protein [Bryobacteraceae bacterium]
MKLRIAKLPLMFAAIGALLAQEGGAVFRSEVRLVEVYATVFDHKGRYLDGLSGSSFELRDEGVPQPIVSFESNLSNLSCGIVLDTTGSMFRALPGVKNAVVHLIEQFRAEDSIAIYSFSTSLQVLQDFTNDKSALKTAVLRTRAAGETALFDSISQAAAAIAKRNGKKAMIVFTDGDDNASVLNSNAALSRVKKLGIPIYTIGEGEAVTSAVLSKGLKEISQVTGGVPYTVKKPKDVETVFEDICEDLQHGYMLTYKPPPAKGFGWRKIELVLNGQKDTRIRAREGYLPE